MELMCIQTKFYFKPKVEAESHALKRCDREEKEIDTGKDPSAVDKGILHVHKYGGNLFVSGKIKTATATDPQDFDSPSYNVEPIWTKLSRNAEYLWTANDDPVGGVDLFAVVSKRGVMEFSPEVRIPAHQIIVLQNVYEVRLRSFKKDLEYRLSEQPLETLT